MRAYSRFSILFLLLLPVVLSATIHKDSLALLRLMVCASAALAIFYVSRTRAEHLWIGARQ
jgi:hypothetical protein